MYRQSKAEEALDWFEKAYEARNELRDSSQVCLNYGRILAVSGRRSTAEEIGRLLYALKNEEELDVGYAGIA